MKKKKINKLMLMSTIAISGFLGFTSLKQVYKNVNAEENKEKVELKTTKKNYASYDDEEYTITLTADELNNYTWEIFYNAIDDEVIDIAALSISYNSIDYYYSSNNDGAILWFDQSESQSISFIYDVQVYNSAYDVDFDNDYIFKFLDSDFVYSINLVSDNTDYNNIKSAIEADIQANTQSNSYGEEITDAIKSGLGLIGDLALQFLTGFSTLFWDSANSQLTDFATFSLILLGLAIVFSIIKLVLSIIRSNTGV